LALDFCATPKAALKISIPYGDTGFIIEIFKSESHA